MSLYPDIQSTSIHNTSACLIHNGSLKTDEKTQMLPIKEEKPAEETEKSHMMPMKNEYEKNKGPPEIATNFSTGRLQCITRILMIFSVSTCALSFIFTIVIMTQNDRKSEGPSVMQGSVFSHPACLQCIKLKNLEEDPLANKLMRTRDNGIEMCCVQDASQMSALLEIILRQRDMKTEDPRPENTDSNLRFTPMSVHKKLLPYRSDYLLEENLKEPYFNNGTKHFAAQFDVKFNEPFFEHVKGVTVEDKALVINYTGLYYIYLSIQMGPKFGKPAGAFKYQNWYQYVHRESPNSPDSTGILLQTSYTACKNCTDIEETTYAGGTFYLTKGDKIQVCLNGLGLVQYNKESTFFGMVMLTSGDR